MFHEIITIFMNYSTGTQLVPIPIAAALLILALIHDQSNSEILTSFIEKDSHTKLSLR